MDSQLIADTLSQEGYTDFDQRLVGAVLRELYGRRRWRFLENNIVGSPIQATVANQGIVPFGSVLNGAMVSTDIKLDAVRVRYGTDQRGDDDIEEVTDVVIKNLRWTDSSPGYPRKWARVQKGSDTVFVNSTIMVWPIPDVTYDLSVDYYAVPDIHNLLIGDQIVWPEEYLNVITTLMKVRLAGQQKDWPAYDRWTVAAKDAYDGMVADHNMTARQTIHEVERWSGWDALV